jgi:predicted acyltransferase
MQRNHALDSLRGIAITGMILSGSVAFNNTLPGWMFHAQVGPPDYHFHPDVPGITWVDLVFPFFLFAMGVAIPLSLHKKIAAQKWTVTAGQIITRGLLLAFFAIYLQHMKAGLMKQSPGAMEYIKSLLAFASMFLIYGIFPKKWSAALQWMLKIFGWAIAAILSLTTTWYKTITNTTTGQKEIIESGFDPGRSDIIILVLANMAVAAALIWWATRHNWWYRLAIIPFILAIFLAKDVEGSINHWIMNFTPVKWLYQFNFHKYLCIVLPGTFAGDLLLRQQAETRLPQPATAKSDWAMAILFFTIPVNLYCLFTRQLELNLLLNLGLLAAGYYLLRMTMPGNHLCRQLFKMGAYCLLLGLLLEAFQGGIKKDSATFSYFFVTTGLASLLLLCLLYWHQHYYSARALCYPFTASGQNPMIAYVAGALLITPLLKLTGSSTWLDALHHNAFESLLKGLLFTGLVLGVAALCTRLRIRWRS